MPFPYENLINPCLAGVILYPRWRQRHVLAVQLLTFSDFISLPGEVWDYSTPGLDFDTVWPTVSLRGQQHCVFKRLARPVEQWRREAQHIRNCHRYRAAKWGASLGFILQ